MAAEDLRAKRRGSLVDAFGTLVAVDPVQLAHEHQRRRLASPTLDERERLGRANAPLSPFRIAGFRRSPSVEAAEAGMAGSPRSRMSPEMQARPGVLRRSSSHTADGSELVSERRLSTPSLLGLLGLDADRLEHGGSGRLSGSMSPLRFPSSMSLNDIAAPEADDLLSDSPEGTNAVPDTPPLPPMPAPAAVPQQDLVGLIRRPVLGLQHAKLLSSARQTPRYNTNPFTPDAQARQMPSNGTPAPLLSPQNTSGVPSTPPPPWQAATPTPYRYGMLSKRLPQLGMREPATEPRGGTGDGAALQPEDIFAALYDLVFVRMEQLGRGSYGTVHRCLHRFDGCQYAVKTMKKYGRSKTIRQAVYREAFAMAAINEANNPNLLRYHTSWEDADHVYIQCELCRGGSIELRADGTGPVLHTEVELVDMLAQVANGLREIHARGLAHLDIKPENIFRNEGVYKIGDFGLMVKALQTSTVSEGDSKYLALEVLRNDLSGLDLRAADMFALGASVYELARGEPLPREDPEWRALREAPPPAIARFSPAFNALVQQLMAVEPGTRPTASAVNDRLR